MQCEQQAVPYAVWLGVTNSEIVFLAQMKWVSQVAAAFYEPGPAAVQSFLRGSIVSVNSHLPLPSTHSSATVCTVHTCVCRCVHMQTCTHVLPFNRSNQIGIGLQSHEVEQSR